MRQEEARVMYSHPRGSKRGSRVHTRDSCLRRNDRIIFYLLASLLLCFLAFSAHADIISDTMRGKELIFQRNYKEAIELFEQLEQSEPSSPTGAFGQMITWQMMMYENSDFRFNDEYKKVEARFEKVARRSLQSHPSSWDLFVTGAGYGMKGFYYLKDDRWFRAVGSAARAVQIMKRTIFEYPNFIDAYLGLGMYNYWRSVLTKNIRFLPFFGDRTALGIEDVERVIKDGTYAKDLAEANMAFMYGQENRWKEGLVIVDKYLIKYPNNIVLHQLKGRLHAWSKEYDKAIAEYKKVMEIDPAMTKSLYYIGWITLKKPDGAQTAKKYFEDFLATNPEKDWAESTKKQLKRLE